MNTTTSAGEVNPRLTDPEFVWTPPVSTDVQATWRKHGWKPPSEQKQDKPKEAA